jgi:mono/diheme cytochrome c family protein
VQAAISTGGKLYASEGCANCHGPEGRGDVGPDLHDVLKTFPACETQVEWVSLGSARWARDRGSAYGATHKPVHGGMPGFGARLPEDQIRKIVSFTRSRFAGGDEISVVRDCLASG